MKYKAVGVYKSGPMVNGYSITDEEDKTLKVKIVDFTELVKAGLVYNFKDIKIDGQVYIVPSNSLISQLDVIGRTEYKIKERMFNDSGAVIGYIVANNDKDELKISIKKAWELAFDECIVNATAYYKEDEGSIKKLIILEE